MTSMPTGTDYDTSLVATNVAASYALSAAEAARIGSSLARNGVAVVRGFVPAADVADLRRAAERTTRPDYAYGAPNSCAAGPIMSEGTRDFRHPFLVSAPATRLVTSGALLDVIEGCLGERAIIHHGVFQRSVPISHQMLDWHIDCGSNKALNGLRKTDDMRIRSILYLTDVTSGGFSYIVGSSAQALSTFYPLPPKQLFPVDAVPGDESRRITFNDTAGALILFNTHGLHRPEVPRSDRLVLNVWFARRDFSANLPAVLFSLNLVPPEQRDRLYVFDGERGFDPLDVPVSVAAPPPSIVRRLARRLTGA